jgi:microcompartment protein CcmK/EutM
MKIARVLGTVTLSRCHPSFNGARLKLIGTLSLEELEQDLYPQADQLVAWDELGAGIDSKVAMSDGGEAAQPFRPKLKPVDCYLSAILDHINL